MQEKNTETKQFQDMTIEVTDNPYHLNLEDIMEVGKRVNNNKRNFLFISKLLGKHIEVKPDICKCTGRLLTSLKYPMKTESLIQYISNQNIDISKELNKAIPINQKTLVIGFAETATGLGMSVAASIKNATYVTTTREEIPNIKKVFTFEEEHSHATTHKMYFDDFYKFDQIILVDDEITTGNSMLNLIKALVKFTNIKNFTILSILDWRNNDQKSEFHRIKRKLKIDIATYALISGQIHSETNETFLIDKETELKETTSATYNFTELERKYGYWKDSGKFGVEQSSIEILEKVCEKIAEKIDCILAVNGYKESDKILILGHGENIYIPSRVAAHLSFDTYFKTTTRSPIYTDGKTIKTTDYFYDKGVKYYFYNKEEIEKKYQKVIMIAEGNCNIKLCDNMMLVRI